MGEAGNSLDELSPHRRANMQQPRTHGDNLELPINLARFWRWEEAGVPGENSCKHMERMKTLSCPVIPACSLRGNTESLSSCARGSLLVFDLTFLTEALHQALVAALQGSSIGL